MNIFSYLFFISISVWNILNVQDVIKEAPNDPEVHWRAVPSLREIWMEERLRMVS